MHCLRGGPKALNKMFITSCLLTKKALDLNKQAAESFGQTPKGVLGFQICHVHCLAGYVGTYCLKWVHRIEWGLPSKIINNLGQVIGFNLH